MTRPCAVRKCQISVIGRWPKYEAMGLCARCASGDPVPPPGGWRWERAPWNPPKPPENRESGRDWVALMIHLVEFDVFP